MIHSNILTVFFFFLCSHACNSGCVFLSLMPLVCMCFLLIVFFCRDHLVLSFLSLSRCIWPGRRYSGSEVLLFYFLRPRDDEPLYIASYFLFVTYRCSYCFIFALCLLYFSLVHIGDRTSVFYTVSILYYTTRRRLGVVVSNRVSTLNARRSPAK